MTVITLSIILMIALIGVIVIATPYLMPPTECFTITVPPSAKDDPRIKSIYRGHTVLTGVVTLACLLAIALLMPGADDVSASAVILVATLLPPVASFAYMLHARSRIREIKQAEGWTVSQAHSAAFVSDDSIPEPMPIAWELLHVVVVLVLAAIALLAYDRLPDQIPMHADLDGTVNSYAEKTLGTVMFPVLIAVFMGATMAFTHWMILRSKKPIDPAAPATSALAYGEYARAQSIVMLVGGLVLNACIGCSFFLSSAGIITLGAAGAITTGAVLVFVAAEIFVSVKYGQAGGRLAAELRTSDGIERDDDALWKAGVFYFNPDDPSIIVPKRFGSGWTINHARPAAWLAIIGLIVVSVLFAIISLKVAG